MIAESSFSRKSLFLGFPSCAFGVGVPISIKPKPRSESSENIFASFSNPAARPTGFLNFKPKTSLSRRLTSGGFLKKSEVRNPNFFNAEKVK